MLLTAFVVNSLADGPPAADGLLTLREALEAANTNAASGDAAAGSADGDTIAFAAGLAGTILLTNGELVIADDVEIDGEGDITVDAGGAGRVFRVDTAAAAGDVDVLFAGLRIVRGDAAGATGGGLRIAAGGDVTLRGTAVAFSRAARGGGIYTAGRLVVELSLVRANVADDGGGIYVGGAGTLQVLRSSVLGNAAAGNALDAAAGRGGGIFFSSDDGDPLTLRNDLLVDQSYVNDNTASRAGGGVEIDGVEYALLKGSVLRGNVAGPAGSTTVGRGGALHVTDAVPEYESEAIQVHFYRTTVEGNVAGHQGGGLWNDVGSRMVADGSILRGNVAVGDAEDDVRSPPLEAGGGGGICNCGTLLVHQSVVDDNAALHGRGGGLLIGGSGEGARSPRTTVYVTTVAGNSAARAGGGIRGAHGRLVLDRSAVHENAAGDGSAGGSAPLGDGGGLHLDWEHTIVYRTDVRDNVADRSGGGIWNAGYLLVQLSYVRSNTATGDADDGGGGIYNDKVNSPFVRVEDSVVSQNATNGRGGGIYCGGSRFVLSRTTVGENVAARSGGGVEVVTGEFDVDRSLVYGNQAGVGPGGPGLRGDGGGLHVSGEGADVWVYLSRIRDNVASFGDAEGGGLWNQAGSTMTVERSTVSGNTAAGPGDGIFNNQGELVLLDSILLDEILTGDSTSVTPA